MWGKALEIVAIDEKKGFCYQKTWIKACRQNFSEKQRRRGFVKMTNILKLA